MSPCRWTPGAVTCTHVNPRDPLWLQDLAREDPLAAHFIRNMEDEGMGDLVPTDWNREAEIKAECAALRDNGGGVDLGPEESDDYGGEA